MDDAAKAQLKKHVTATAWTDYESSVVEDLGRAVVDWWEKAVEHPARGPGIVGLHRTLDDVVSAWSRYGKPADPDEEDLPHRPMKRLIVHCRMSMTGADWQAGEVCALIDRAQRIEWADRGGHDLVIQGADGLFHAFDVVKPETAPWGPLQTWEVPA